MMKAKGYILLEVVICLGLASLIFLCVSVMTFNFSNLNRKMIMDKDKLENAQLGHHFLCEQIRRADKIKIFVNKDYALKSITTYVLNDGIYKFNHTFEFKNNELKFGGVSDSGTSFNNCIDSKKQHTCIPGVFSNSY